VRQRGRGGGREREEKDKGKEFWRKKNARRGKTWKGGGELVKTITNCL
jgi:hypothetical protein